jgi:esterase
MKLFYRKYGSGPPLVVLHGLYGSSDNWVSIAKKISDRYTVYLPDLRNHGQSPHSREHNYKTMANDLHEMIEDLNIVKFLLAGHSMGGKVAMKYALEWPESLYSLVIIDISPSGTTDRNNVIYLQHLEILETILSVRLPGIRSRDEVDKQLSERIDSEKTRALIMKNLRRTDDGSFEWKLNAKSLLENINNIMEGIITPGQVINHVTGFPVTFVRGELSEYIQQDDFKAISSIFPAAEMKVVKGAGHWINAEKPDEIADILLNAIDPD